jgi:hypothetical protein
VIDAGLGQIDLATRSRQNIRSPDGRGVVEVVGSPTGQHLLVVGAVGSVGSNPLYLGGAPVYEFVYLGSLQYDASPGRPMVAW